MIHLTLQQLSCFLDGELTEASTELIRRHLSECATCTGRFARIEAQEEIMARVLVDEPDDPFFLQLSDSLGLGSVAGTKPSEATPAAAKPHATLPREEEKRAAAVPAREAKPKPAREKKAKARPAPDGNANAKAPARVEAMAPPASPSGPKPEPVPHAEREAEAPRLPAPEPRTAPLRARQPVESKHPGRRAEDVARQGQNAVAQRITIAALVVILGSLAWVVLHRLGSGPASGRAPAPVSVAPAPQPRPEATSPEATQTPAPEPAPEAAAASPVESPEPVVATSPSSDAMPPTETTQTVEPQTPTPAPTLKPAPKPAPKATPKRAPKAATVRSSPPARATRVATAATEAKPPEHIVERPPKIVVPVRTIITETVLDPEASADSAVAPGRPPAPAAPASEAAAPAAAGRALSEAKSASLRAATAKDPAAWDAAATSWDRAIPLLSQSPEDLAVARRELAQARFQAWADSPTASRRDAAIAAARVYLLYAPPGPERDQAWTWLARLKR